MAEDSAGEVPKLLRKDKRDRRRDYEEMEDESSRSCSDLEDEMYVSKSWKKFGKRPRHLETVEVRTGLRASPFYFQKRASRIDWRTLHAINVDTLIQEIDICKLETVLDTITFGDIQGEDTRNFTEQNFIKLFRLAQLMIEYLLHVQGVLSDQKSQLISTTTIAQRRAEKLRLRCLWQRDALKQAQRDLRHARKTLKTYELLLRSSGGKPASVQQVHHCPYCEKVFESSYYLDLHVSRRHVKSDRTDRHDRSRERAERYERHERPEKHHDRDRSYERVVERLERSERYDRPERDDRLQERIAMVSRPDVRKSKEQLKAETEAILQAEFERRVHTVSHKECSAHLPTESSSSDSAAAAIDSLQRALRESNTRLDMAEHQLEVLQSEIPVASQQIYRSEHYEDDFSRERLRMLEEKVECVQGQLSRVHKENIRLKTELEGAYKELSSMRSERRQITSEHQQVDIEELIEKHVGKLKRQLPPSPRDAVMVDDSTSDDDFIAREHERNVRAVREWISETDERFTELNVSEHEEHRSYHSHHSHHSEPVSPTIRQLMEADDQTIASDKERWLKDHPHAPISEMPYALSKYPHGSSTVSTMQEKLTGKFDSRLNEELKKFGISSNAKGISDELFSAAITTLERQRTNRYRESPVHDRRIMEYERSTIQWHIERAVKSRDMEKMESIFEEETAASESEENILSEVSKEEIQETTCRTSGHYSAEKRSKTSKTSKTSLERSSPSSPPPSRKTKGFTEQFVSKEYSWQAEDECESQIFKVTGQVIAQRVKSPSSEGQHIVLSPVGSPKGAVRMTVNEEEQIEEELGLGEWDSDGKASSARSPDIQRQVMRDIQSRMGSPSSEAKKKGKQPVTGTTTRSKQQVASSSASEDIKMLDELDAEINELIKE